MDANTPRSSLEQIDDLMRTHQVEYLVIGGLAEVLMGSPRVTYDVDLCYRRTPSNIEALARAIQPLRPTLRGAPADLPFVIDAVTISNGCNFTFNTTLGAVDLLGYVEPIGQYEDLLPGSEESVVAGRPIRIIGLEDLIRVKQHIARSKDQESLFQLLAIRIVRTERDAEVQ